MPKQYRNITEIKGIDPQSLWHKTKNGFVLNDKDQYINVSLKNESEFTKC